MRNRRHVVALVATPSASAQPSLTALVVGNTDSTDNTDGRDGAIRDAHRRAAFERHIRAGGGYADTPSASVARNAGVTGDLFNVDWFEFGSEE